MWAENKENLTLDKMEGERCQQAVGLGEPTCANKPGVGLRG